MERQRCSTAALLPPGNDVVSADFGQGVNKWWGAALSMEDVFFLPQNHSHVLRFDPATAESRQIGDDMGTAIKKYNGACTAGNGLI